MCNKINIDALHAYANQFTINISVFKVDTKKFPVLVEQFAEKKSSCVYSADMKNFHNSFKWWKFSMWFQVINWNIATQRNLCAQKTKQWDVYSLYSSSVGAKGTGVYTISVLAVNFAHTRRLWIRNSLWVVRVQYFHVSNPNQWLSAP